MNQREFLNKEFDKVENMAFQIYLQERKENGGNRKENLDKAFHLAREFYNAAHDEREQFLQNTLNTKTL